jgi:hypothetical protein
MAERDVSFRAEFVLDPLPKEGRKVQVLLQNARGAEVLTTASFWPFVGWVDLDTFLKIEEPFLAGGPWPFRELPSLEDRLG